MNDASEGAAPPPLTPSWSRDSPRDVGELEIVVAIVSPVGSPTDNAMKILAEVFIRHGYTTQDVRISDLLDRALPTPEIDADVDRWTRQMNKGDAFRSALADQAAAAILATQAIQRIRTALTGSPFKNAPRQVWMVRSLKRAEEVRVLRQIYGERLIVVGLGAPEEQRRKRLIDELARARMQERKAKALAAELMDRDENDEQTESGQRVRDAFELCDAYLGGKPDELKAEAERVVELLLGQPWTTPSRDEQAMFHAHAAKFRSSAAGRQVGAAIVDEFGEVVALGCNDVPRPGGGQFWPDDPMDRRDFRLDADANDAGKFDAVRELLAELAEAGWLDERYKAMADEARAEAALRKADGPLRDTRVRNLIEFGRILHAEMAALMTAARDGRPIRGCTLFTTTYPCHECTRLIIGAGIARIVYIDPYPKSLASEMYGEMLDEARSEGHVQVNPFTGVAPRLFPRVFDLRNRSKDIKGTYAGWTDKSLRTTSSEFSNSMFYQEAAAAKYIEQAQGEGDAGGRLGEG